MPGSAISQYLKAKQANIPFIPTASTPATPAAGVNPGGPGKFVESTAPPVQQPVQAPPVDPPGGDSGSSGQSGVGTGIDVGAIPAAVFPGGSGGGSGDSGSSTVTPDTPSATAAPLPSTSGATPDTNAGSTALSFAQVENFWIQAGGSPQAAAMAAAVSDAESGLNAAAQRTNPDGSLSIGLWGIPANGMPPGSTDPLANARAAVQLSQGGTDWSQWCSTWSDNNCGENNGTYLGQGANALMSLATQKSGASYNVFGSAPAGSGVGASSATSGLSVNSASGGSSKLPILIMGLVIGVVVIFMLVNRKKAGKDTTSQAGQDVSMNDPKDTGDIYVPAHTRHRNP
jgi:hypothetical protein